MSDPTLITPARSCDVTGCTGRYRARGRCSGHYRQWQREQARAAGLTCSVDSCENPPGTKGLCDTHYMRKWKHGDVSEAKPIRTAIPDGSAWCPDCKALKPASEFHANASRANGLANYCKVCTVERRRTLYADQYRAYQREWIRANPERMSAYNRRWATANRDKVRLKKARYKLNYPEKHRLHVQAGSLNRRARKRAAAGRATVAQVTARWDYYGGLCWMCCEPADEIDHVKPLVKGGCNWPSNLRPACRTCNASKRARWPFVMEVARGGDPARG